MVRLHGRSARINWIYALLLLAPLYLVQDPDAGSGWQLATNIQVNVWGFLAVTIVGGLTLIMILLGSKKLARLLRAWRSGR